ncbi:hypothetical protein ACFPM0_00660 [Pseudonocardia sulfidoxydans]|uniref:hypothetical protein n=1 Tax=Pseudonocardia sulfidoxydans TaxID=54011 RepID=UPI003610E5E8
MRRPGQTNRDRWRLPVPPVPVTRTTRGRARSFGPSPRAVERAPGVGDRHDTPMITTA